MTKLIIFQTTENRKHVKPVINEPDRLKLTGMDSRTLDTAGVAAFPSTKRKKVDTPITL